MTKHLFVRLRGASALAMSAMLLAGGMAAPAFAQDTETSAQAETADTSIAAWGITEAELETDPSIVYGVLENGMRYALKRNAQPAEEASIRLMIEAGTRDEFDAEEGAAHFVEHMAFNGSTNIPEGELVPRLERLGLAFGADTNAETAPNYTMYKLDLPRLDEETVESALEILREMSSELTIAPEAVERERGIILSEFQVRNSPDRRRIEAFLRGAMARPRIADRVTAEPETIRSITPEILRGFYEGFYRPENATLVVVGDFDIAEMERRIANRFASWEGKGEARENYSADVAETDGVKVITFNDPATPELVELQRVVPYKQTDNSVAEYAGEWLDTIASIAITQRLTELAKVENPRTIGGQAAAQELFASAQSYGVVAVAKDGEWEKSLAVAMEEWRRAAEFGFTNSEVAQAKAAILSALETAVAQSKSTSNAALATTIAMSSPADEVVQSPDQSLALYRQIADAITPEVVKANFLAKWGTGPTLAMVSTKTEIEGAQAAIANVLNTAQQVALTAPEEKLDKPFAYTDFGPAGEVVSDKRIDDLGIRAITFANGVELNLKKTDFEPGNVLVQVEVGTGLSSLTDMPGIDLVTQVLGSGDDLGQHTADELNRLVAGKQAGYGYSLSEEAVVLSHATTPADLLFQLQLTTAQITDTAFSAQLQRQWEGAAPIIATNVRADPQQMFGVTFGSVLTDGDTRMGMADPAQLVERSVEDLKTVIGSQFAEGRIEIGIVGDIDDDVAIAAVASTLGALNRPRLVAPALPAPKFRSDRGVQTIYHTGQTEQGMIALSWPADDGFDRRSAQTRLMLSELIGLEALKVLREELGATYTPSSVSDASSVYRGYGHLSLIAPATPDSMDEVSKVIRDLVAGFIKNPPSEDDMLRARQPILEQYKRSVATNGGWVELVVDAQSTPERLDWRRNRAQLLSEVTPADVQAAARKYLSGEPLEIRVIPAPQEAAAGE